jgi:molybdopterin/thiamine biosynthesis adenylyltransferase
LTKEEVSRYSRQLILPQVGAEGTYEAAINVELLFLLVSPSLFCFNDLNQKKSSI